MDKLSASFVHPVARLSATAWLLTIKLERLFLGNAQCLSTQRLRVPILPFFPRSGSLFSARHPERSDASAAVAIDRVRGDAKPLRDVFRFETAEHQFEDLRCSRRNRAFPGPPLYVVTQTSAP